MYGSGLWSSCLGADVAPRVELALKADDVVLERNWIIAAGWPLAEDLRDRPSGLKDFRVLDPAGYYLRIRDRAR